MSIFFILTLALDVFLPSITTPCSSFFTLNGSTIPSILARYTFVTSDEGWFKIFVSSPSFVSNKTPVVS